MNPFQSQHPREGMPTGAALGSPILARVIGLVRPLMSVVGVASTAIIAANFVLPAGFGPSAWIGKFHGGIESADATTKADAVTALTRKTTEAAAVPPAMTQMEINAFAVQQQIIQQSLGLQSFIANLADGACVMGGVVAAVGDGSDQSRDAARALSKGCDAGDHIRANMVRELRQAGQEGSTVIRRSMPQ